MTGTSRDARRVVLRDLIIFQAKLFMDGLKDVVLVPVSVVAAGLDLVFPGPQPGRLFYRVLRVGERYDRWLSLFSAAERADSTKDGLFGASRAGSDTMLGGLEAMILGHDEPRSGQRKR